MKNPSGRPRGVNNVTNVRFPASGRAVRVPAIIHRQENPDAGGNRDQRDEQWVDRRSTTNDRRRNLCRRRRRIRNWKHAPSRALRTGSGSRATHRGGRSTLAHRRQDCPRVGLLNRSLRGSNRSRRAKHQRTRDYSAKNPTQPTTCHVFPPARRGQNPTFLRNT